MSTKPEEQLGVFQVQREHIKDLQDMLKHEREHSRELWTELKVAKPIVLQSTMPPGFPPIKHKPGDTLYPSSTEHNKGEKK